MKITLVTVFSLIYVFTIAFLYFFNQVYLDILDKNLPFRESYFPTFIGILLTYFAPLIIGYGVGFIFYKKNNKSFIYLLNICLLVSITYFLPSLFSESIKSQNWFYNHIVLYQLVIVPILLLIGCYPFYFDFEITQVKSPAYKKFKKYDVAVLSLFSILIFILNLIPVSLSNYLVGADVYYHASMTNIIQKNQDILQNPFFYEEKNYYYSIVYFPLAYIEKLTHVGIVNIWRFVVPFASLIFLSFFYIFARRSIGSTLGALIATLFIAPFNQILWADPSLRIFSYTFFIIFLVLFQSLILTKKKLYILGVILFLFLTASSHPEIAIHAVYIILIYLILSNFSFFKNIINKVFSGITLIRTSASNGFSFNVLNSPEALATLLVICSLIILNNYQFLLNNFSIDKILIFNEIPLSILQPVGAISLISFIFFLPGVYTHFKRANDNDLLLISIASLFLTSFFYFTYVWFLYHRYFTETAYFAISIISAGYLSRYLNTIKRTKKALLLTIVFGFFVISIVPKYSFIVNYSKASSNNIVDRRTDFSLIKKNTEVSSVIMVEPDDMINRYIPVMTGRFIFSGSGFISKEHQWQILSFCNGPYREACLKRITESDSFFNDPSIEIVKDIKTRYRVDYLLINKNTEGEYPRFKKSNLEISERLKAEDNNYILIDLKEF